VALVAAAPRNSRGNCRNRTPRVETGRPNSLRVRFFVALETL
jgi:hypothetical protein